jgi:small subunit ribosomal protein S1
VRQDAIWSNGLLNKEKAAMADRDWPEPNEETDSRPEPDSSMDNDDAVDEDFASLLEESLRMPKRFSRGDRVRGRVIGLNDEWVFVDLGGKGEGVVAVAELKASEEQPNIAVGDLLDAYYLGETDGEVQLTIRISGADVSRALLEEAFQAKIPVEGKVQKEIKGGFEVLIGGSRAFCPYSQMGLYRQDAAAYLGLTLSFLIMDFEAGGKNIVVSRRLLLEAERRERYEQLRATLEVGARVEGTVRAVEAFGVFVDIGGIDGLIPMSELSWGRVADPREVVTVGQKIEAQVLELDWDRKRIGLSLKRLTPDPWNRIHELLAEEQVVSGRVVTLAQYGAFVEVLPGIDGLIHVSRLALGRRIHHPREVLSEGQEVQVRIQSIDSDQRRLGLSLETAADIETQSSSSPHPQSTVEVVVGSVVTATVVAVKLFGVLARLPDGRTGLIPVAELLMPKKEGLRRHYKLDQPVTVQVMDITDGGRRIRLSEKSAQEAGEAQELSNYMETGRAAKGSGLGTLGDLLKKGRK